MSNEVANWIAADAEQTAAKFDQEALENAARIKAERSEQLLAVRNVMVDLSDQLQAVNNAADEVHRDMAKEALLNKARHLLEQISYL